MYADRRAPSGGFHPGNLAVALGINAAVIAALLHAAPDILPFTPPDPPLETYRVVETPPPPPEPVPADPVVTRQPRPAPRPDAPLTIVERPPAEGDVPIADPPIQPASTDGIGTGAGTGAGGVTVDPPRPALPMLVQPSIDSRYAADFQPDYPSEERRAGREGRVVVRVLIGMDGRVKQVERVSATSDAFYRATLNRATSRWRFRPGTRDGIPVEAWRTMSLTFVLEN